MSNSTTTYWDIDGISLNTFAWNIETWGGDREAPPGLRGSDITVPYRPGDLWQSKVPGSRTITLNMWVLGATEDGAVPTSVTQRQQFEANLKALRKLVWTPGRQIALTKRFTLPGSGTVISATAMAEFAGGFTPTMTGNTRAVFSVDLRLADPFFYGAEVTENFTSSTRNRTITVAGDYDTTVMRWTLNGAVGPIILINNNSIPGISLGVSRSFAIGEIGTIDVDIFKAVHQTAGPVFTRFPGAIIPPEDDPYWFRLRPGSNAITVSTGGSGTIVLKYSPRWI